MFSVLRSHYAEITRYLHVSLEFHRNQ